MDLIPAIVAVSDVGASNADVVADAGCCDLGRKSRTGRRGLLFGRGMVADHLNDEAALRVHDVCQIQG
jgi:hypothetical protein